jgi:hypothetical protein
MHEHFSWIFGLIVFIVYFLAFTTETDPAPHPYPLPFRDAVNACEAAGEGATKLMAKLGRDVYKGHG